MYFICKSKYSDLLFVHRFIIVANIVPNMVTQSIGQEGIGLIPGLLEFIDSLSRHLISTSRRNKFIKEKHQEWAAKELQIALISKVISKAETEAYIWWWKIMYSILKPKSGKSYTCGF